MPVLDVQRIGFAGRTGDDRTPEDFPFPAAMTSLMKYLGEDMPEPTIEAHGRKWTQRAGNIDFVAASGIGFALLWEDNLCPSAMDTMQAVPYDKAIDNAFRWAGWAYERVSGADMRPKGVEAIDRGTPFIAWNLTNVPEAALVCGCEDGGDTLLAWSHFPEGMETRENGMIAAPNWTRNVWEIAIPTRRTGRTIDTPEILREGARIMAQNTVEGYRAGDAAYEAWINAVQSRSDEALYQYHHSLLFNLAEARCWTGDFCLAREKAVGARFKRIHDLCWQADAAAPNAAAFADPEKRAALLRTLYEIRETDRAALAELRN